MLEFLVIDKRRTKKIAKHSNARLYELRLFCVNVCSKPGVKLVLLLEMMVYI